MLISHIHISNRNHLPFQPQPVWKRRKPNATRLAKANTNVYQNVKWQLEQQSSKINVCISLKVAIILLYWNIFPIAVCLFVGWKGNGKYLAKIIAIIAFKRLNRLNIDITTFLFIYFFVCCGFFLAWLKSIFEPNSKTYVFFGIFTSVGVVVLRMQKSQCLNLLKCYNVCNVIRMAYWKRLVEV